MGLQRALVTEMAPLAPDTALVPAGLWAQRREQRWVQSPDSPGAPAARRGSSCKEAYSEERIPQSLCPRCVWSSPVRMATLSKQPSSLLSRMERKLSAASTLASRVLWSYTTTSCGSAASTWGP